MINFTNLISKVSKVSKVSQQNCESRMGTCLALAKHSPSTYLPVDSVSIVSRQSDLDQVRAASVGLSARVWKHVAMIFAVLVMSMANIGMAWGADATFTMSSIFTGSNTSASVSSPVNATVSTTTNASNADDGKLGSDGNYFQVLLSDDTFTDVSFNGYINTDNTSKNWAFQFTTNGGSTWGSEVTQANDGTKSAHDIEVGVSIPSGANGIRIIRRAGTSTYVYSITFALAGGVTKPSFSPATGSSLVKSSGTVTLTSAGNTVYYKWSQTDNQYASGAGATLAGAADGSGSSPVDATAPSTTGTWYLYAVAKNGGDYSNVVKATYTITNPTYTVSYNLNGGKYNGSDDAPTQEAVESGTNITMPVLAPTKADYAFVGWRCSVNSADYMPSASYTMTAANTTFTAQWATACFEVPDARKNSNPAATITASMLKGNKIAGGTLTWESASDYTGNGDHGLILNEDGEQIVVTLNEGAFVAGSIITITTHGNSGTSKTCGVKVSGNNMTPATYSTESTGYRPFSQTYVVQAGDGIVGTNTFAIKRYNSNQVYIYSITVSGCGAPSCTAPTSPSISGTTAYTEGQNISLTASATGTDGSTTYTWYKGTDWATASAGSSIGSAATFAKASCVVGDAGTYWCNISNGTGCEVQTSTTITVVASACDWNINYITNGLKDGNGSAVWSEDNCFEQVGSTNEWILEDFEMPNVNGQFWVGPGEFKAPGDWGHSVIADLTTIKWVYRSDKTRTDKSAVTDMTGTLNIWDNGGDDNYHIGIYPDYQITYGVDGSGGWTKVDFNHVSGTEYRTAIVTAPSGYKNNDNFKYYVGLRTKDNGNTYWGDHSSTVKMNGMSGMSSTDQAGKKGQWKMYEDSGNDNYYCSWIPVYTLTYNANGGSGAPATQEVISDAVPCQWTLSTTQPTWADHVFLGWSTNSSASVPDAASEVADLGTPYPATGDVTLYAVWTSCSGPTINSFVPTGTTDGTYPVGTALGTLTVTASAGNGGALSYLWYQYDGGNIGAAVAAAGTNNAATYSIPNNAACVDRHYYCVVSEAGCSTTRTSDASGALTLTAASLTAIECNTLYKVEDMVPASITLSGSGQYGAGLSSNTKFEVIGDPAQTDGAAGTPEMKNEAASFAEQSFTARMYLKGASNTTGSGTTFVPTSRAVKFIVSESGTLDIYAHRVDRLYLKKVGDSGTTQLGTSTSGSGSMVSHNVTAGTYYIYATGNSTCVYGIKLNCCSDPVINEGTTKTSFAGGSWPQNSGHTITITATGADSYEWYRNTSATDAGATKLSETSNTLDITADVAAGTYFYKAIAKSGACSSSTEWGWCGAMTITAVTYSITYNCNGAESGCPSNVAAASNLPNPLPTGLTKDGYDFGGWFTDSECTVAAVAGAALTGNTDLYAKWTEHIASECITITNFETSQHSNSSNKPDSQGKYIYGYMTTVDAEHAVTITTSNTNNKGQNSNADMLVQYGTSIYIYADNTTTGGTPATFSNVTSVSLKIKNKHATDKSNFTIKVGSTTIANAVSLTDANNSTYTTYTYSNLAQLSGKIEIHNGGSGSTNFNFFVDDIEICTADMAACTTPVIPSLSNQALCEGANATAWDATVTNAAAISAAGETVSYQWQLKNGSNWDNISGATSASYDVSDAVTEAMAGTYRVLVTVSKAGYSSSSATREVTLSVTESTEVTGITANKATVYPGNSVTLTATANTTVTWQWYTCTNAEGAGEASIGEATSASYTIASAPAAGTYYYKAKGTSSCGTDEMVYTLTVSAAAGGDCETEIWVVKAADLPEGATAATHITTPFTGGSNESASITIDGNTYTITQRSSNATGPATIVVPEDNIGTLYILVKGNGGRSVILEKGGVEQWTATPDDGWQSLSVGNLAAGTYSLRSSNNLGWGLLALKLCSAVACSDPEVTASADNSTICVGGSVTFTAANAHASATYQWQKYSGSAWTNISGATSATYTIDPVAAGDEAKYRVIASHDCNRTSNEVTLSVPSAPDFGSTVPASVSIMETLALSISTVEATDAVKYKWYKSADDNWDAGDAEIGTEKNLIKAYDGETAGSTYYIFCRAQNACGITTSSAITVTVTAYVEEDCAIRGNEGEAGFGFENTGMSSGTYDSKNVWYKNSNSNYLTYTAPEGKYLATAKVTIASSSSSNASYQYSTDNGANWSSGVTISGLTTSLVEKTINLPANVTDFRIGRNLDGAGESSGIFYLHKICFTYTNSCTTTTVTPSTSTKTHTIGNSFTKPTFTLAPVAVSGETLTYSSSDEDIATVDDDGTVTFQGMAGTVKIIASYAGGTIAAVDYCASEGYYTITVSCSAGTPKVVVTAGSTNLSGCNASVTLSAKTQEDGDFVGGSYQWYRDGSEVSGATSSSFSPTQAGTYTVEFTKDGCTALSNNSIPVTSESTQPEVERLVPFQYYHVDKTYTDQMKMRHLFAVKNSGKLDGKSFKLYVSRNGDPATDVTNSNALAIWTNADGRVDTVMIDLNKLSGKYAEDDELVYTCKAIDCSGNVSEVYKATIQMRVIGATPTLALICSGSDKEGGTRKTGELTVGGDFLTGYNKADLCEQTGNTSFDASTEWGLYTRLKANYIVTPVNGYAVFNKLNYEPFDILLLTDYPKASKSDAAKDVLDDMAALCDYRPMLSFKTHMVAKSPSKWAAKGFTTEPVAVKQGDGRTHLNIVCYAHPMFDGIKDAGDHIFLDNSERSHIVYEMLTGAGHESDKGIQGFEIAAAENFVTIGLIHYNASIAENSPSTGLATWTGGTDKGGKPNDRMLVAAMERQANPEARMVVLAVNCGAQSKFTETGRTIVHKCLQYLLSDHTITPMADCSFTFDNGANAPHNAEWYKDPVNCPGCTGELGDHKWSTAANWSPDRLSPPGKNTEVKIAAPVEVDMDHAVARSARIVEGGHISIPAGKALEIVGTIRRLDGSEISPTENSDITIGSSAAGNGSLIFNNDKGDSKARVLMYSTAQADIEHMSAATSTWQYIGTPHNDIGNAQRNYYDSWLYQYDVNDGWVVIPNGGPLVPFRGYCVTHPNNPNVYDMEGTLVATTSQEIAIPAGKFVVAANSWVAPIDINKFTDDDFEGISDKTIYFFNTGSDTEGNGGTGTAAGTYRASPIKAAAYTGDWQIPSMQGFYIGSTTAGTLHLDYDRHVRQNGGSKVGNPMYAPQRFADDNEPEVAKLYFRGSRYFDRLVVLEREDFTRGYDSGWDGEAWGGNSASPLSCVSGEGRWDAVSAIPEFEGTVVGFQAGEDNAYTIDFEYSEEYAPLYLYDTEAKTYSRVLTGNAYYFTTSDKDYHDRFFFTRNAPSVITGIEPTSDSSLKGRAKKLLIEDKLFILLNGVLYDATGKVVK